MGIDSHVNCNDSLIAKGGFAMYKIGEFSKLCQVSVNTLRYYDSEELLCPEYTDGFTGYRYYSGESLQRYHMISVLKDAGFPLDEIKIILKSGGNIDLIVDNRKKELQAELLLIEDRLIKLSAIKKSLQKEGKIMFGVTVKKSGDFKIASIRKLLVNRAEIAGLIAEKTDYLKKHNSACENAVVINYEIEHQVTKLDYEVGVVFTGKLPKNCPYRENNVDTGEQAASVVCALSELENAYAALIQYIGEHNYQMTGAYHEIYHNNDTVEIGVPVHKLSPYSSDPKLDVLDLPFENDEAAIGHWEIVDCLACREQFNKDKIKYTGQKDIKEIYFLPGGERYWCFAWTKGYLLARFGSPQIKGANQYEIAVIGGEKYMFIEMKSWQYAHANGWPEVWVLRQLDNKAHTKQEVRIKDRTDLPFVTDAAAIGKWAVCDLVKDIGLFDPDIPNPQFPKEALFWKTVEFVDGGNCKIAYDDATSYEQPHYTWTKDYVLAHISFAAEKYTLIRIKSCDYLFIEWKSGDYSFGGQKPLYYVFRRDEK